MALFDIAGQRGIPLDAILLVDVHESRVPNTVSRSFFLTNKKGSITKAKTGPRVIAPRLDYIPARAATVPRRGQRCRRGTKTNPISTGPGMTDTRVGKTYILQVGQHRDEPVLRAVCRCTPHVQTVLTHSHKSHPATHRAQASVRSFPDLLLLHWFPLLDARSRLDSVLPFPVVPEYSKPVICSASASQILRMVSGVELRWVQQESLRSPLVA